MGNNGKAEDAINTRRVGRAEHVVGGGALGATYGELGCGLTRAEAGAGTNARVNKGMGRRFGRGRHEDGEGHSAEKKVHGLCRKKMHGGYAVCRRGVTCIIHQVGWVHSWRGSGRQEQASDSNRGCQIRSVVLHVALTSNPHGCLHRQFCGVHLLKMCLYLATKGPYPGQGRPPITKTVGRLG